MVALLLAFAGRFSFMVTHAEFLAQKRFGSLDGLRAISILGVIWHHTAASSASGVWRYVGAEGVTLFFAISGFLITTLLLRERAKAARIDLSAFYWRRALRIFPLYYGVLLLYVVLVWLMERHSAAGQAFFGNLIYFATYTSNLFVAQDQRTIFYFAWSLAMEEQFYLLWPPILVLCASLRNAFVAMLAFIALCVAGQLMGQRFLSAVPLAIVYGALLAMVLHTEGGYRVLSRALGFAGAPVLLSALVAMAFVADAPKFTSHLLIAALVISCVIREDHVLRTALEWRPLAFMGVISYGMYMLHMLSKNVAGLALSRAGFGHDGVVQFFATLVVSVIAAKLSFRYYEGYFLKLKRPYER